MSEQTLPDNGEVYNDFYEAAEGVLAVFGDAIALSKPAYKIEEAVDEVSSTYGKGALDDKRVITVAAIAICDAAEFWPEDTSLDGGNNSHV